MLCMSQDIIKRERSHVSSQQSEGPAGRYEGVAITTHLPSISSAPPAGLARRAVHERMQPECCPGIVPFLRHVMHRRLRLVMK